MEDELSVRAGEAERGPARTGSRADVPPELWGLVTRDLRRVLSWGTLLIALVIIVLPVVQGLTRASAYRLVDNFDLFDLMISDWLPALFPLLVTMLYNPRFSGELSHGFVRSTRTRVPLGTFVASRLIVGAVVAFTVFFLAIAVAWTVAFVVNAGHGVVDVSGWLPGETTHPVETRTAFSRLYAASPAIFGLALAVWVGGNAALWSVVGGLSLLLVSNRFLALALPTIAFLVAEVGIAFLRVEGFGLVASVFQVGVVQQEAWKPFVQFGVLFAVVAATVWWVRSRDYDTPGVE